MKPFNLEAAKAGAPVQTRDGLPARILCFDRKGSQPIIALVLNNQGIENVQSYSTDGHWADSGTDRFDDLVMAPIKRSGFIAINPATSPGMNAVAGCSHVYSTAEAAREYYGNYTDTIVIPVEWEE